MSMNDFTKFVQAIKTAYPKENLLSTKEAIEYWYQLLQDLPFDKLMTFLAKWSCSEKWSPTIAEIRKGCLEMSQETVPDWGLGWSEFQKAKHSYGWMRGDEALPTLSPITREVVQRLGWQNLCTSPVECEMSDRSQFKSLYEMLASKELESRQMPEALRQQVRSYIPGTEENLLAQFSEVDDEELLLV